MAHLRAFIVSLLDHRCLTEGRVKATTSDALSVYVHTPPVPHALQTQSTLRLDLDILQPHFQTTIQDRNSSSHPHTITLFTSNITLYRFHASDSLTEYVDLSAFSKAYATTDEI
jgi:hypothetical protein